MQKKILLGFFSVCMMTAGLHAQIKKGAIFLGGQIGFSTNKTNNEQTSPVNPPYDTKSTNFAFSPVFGKAVKDNLIVGADIKYVNNKYQTDYPQDQKTNSYGLGFFVRKYKDLGKGFYLFGQARAGASYNTQKYYNTVTTVANSLTKGYTIQLAIYPGIAYSVSSRLQLEAGFDNLGFLEFDHSRETFPPTAGSYAVTNGFSAGSSLSSFSGFTIGFRYILN